MSRENVKVGLRGIDALNRRDADALVRVCDPDIEFHAYFSHVLGGTFKGHSDMRAYLREVTETFEEFVVEPERIEDRGDLIVSEARAQGRGVSGVDVEWRAVVATRFRNGKVWRIPHPRTRGKPSKRWGCGSRARLYPPFDLGGVAGPSRSLRSSA